MYSIPSRLQFTQKSVFSFSFKSCLDSSGHDQVGGGITWFEFWLVDWDSFCPMSCFRILKFYTSSTSSSGLISLQIRVFGLKIKCIGGITVKYTKGNRTEKGSNLRGPLRVVQAGSLLIPSFPTIPEPKNRPVLKSIPSSHWDFHFLFPLPPRASSSAAAARMVSGALVLVPMFQCSSSSLQLFDSLPFPTMKE